MTLARATALLLSPFLVACWPAASDAQTRPPVLSGLDPHGLQRGTTVILTVEGANLGGAHRVLFTHDGLTATIDSYEDLGPDIREKRPGETGAIIQDRARKGRLTLTVTAAADVPTGGHGFRVQTPLGTSSFMPLWVGNEPERQEHEPDNEPAQAWTVDAPVTINGSLATAGDVEHIRVAVRADRDLVVRVVAASLGSELDGTLGVLAEDGRLLASNDDFHQQRDPLLIHRPAEDGTVVIRLADALGDGGDRHHYRLTIGELSYVTAVYPLGTQQETDAALEVQGANLGRNPVARVAAPDDPGRPARAPVLVAGLETAPLNRVRVAVGRHPEILESGTASSPATAQRVAPPLTINGRVARAGESDYFRFEARAGEAIVVEVSADRLGSPLDSVVEVLDADGAPVPRAVLRPVWETTVDLRNHTSTQTGLRLLSWAELNRGDYVYVDRELLRVQELPKGPDEDTFFAQFRGRRVSFEDTTPEGHAILRPVYKVEIHPPGTVLPPNGLPQFELTYGNDDGGPLDGRDSRVHFVAPADGNYLVRLTDARGEGGPDYAYRLTVAPPEPDFELFVSPSNPNVPRGGRVPITVFAWRYGGFDGPIGVSVGGLPAGFTSDPGTMLPGQNSVTLTIAADADAAEVTVPLMVEGRAMVAGRPIVHAARPDEPVSVITPSLPPDVRVVTVSPEVIELAPGERARVTAIIERANGFAGRVPLAVNNLPMNVTVPDIGLNGILVTENQVERSFEIVADEHADPAEQTLYITARVETNGGTSSLHSSAPVRFRVVGTPPAGEP